MMEYGQDLALGVTGAIDKKGRTDEVRVIYDGSNGIWLNLGFVYVTKCDSHDAIDRKSVVAMAT